MNVVKNIKDFIPKSNKNRPGNYMKPLYITVHNTANTKKKEQTQLITLVLLSDLARGGSWHYTVDENCIYQHLPLNENGWHAGDGRGTGNMMSIGIEICENADGNFEKAVENAQWLIRKLMQDQGIPLANVVPHKKDGAVNNVHESCLIAGIASRRVLQPLIQGKKQQQSR
ncbi:hypothetical protein BsIDN1_45230 [Bacillus safensis]|uniref:N-acetylmuramoyl-L-alanine amidase n=1 Tax=Bacillus safensis TaxID=561879 RepID=A0A5S9MDE3_BACIA|nr:hypothetical protein BsIDN1_45230 [Bacillus safensis]